jgi:hypothetical protein
MVGRAPAAPARRAQRTLDRTIAIAHSHLVGRTRGCSARRRARGCCPPRRARGGGSAWRRAGRRPRTAPPRRWRGSARTAWRGRGQGPPCPARTARSASPRRRRSSRHGRPRTCKSTTGLHTMSSSVGDSQSFAIMVSLISSCPLAVHARRRGALVVVVAPPRTVDAAVHHHRRRRRRRAPAAAAGVVVVGGRQGLLELPRGAAAAQRRGVAVGVHRASRAGQAGSGALPGVGAGGAGYAGAGGLAVVVHVPRRAAHLQERAHCTEQKRRGNPSHSRSCSQ